MKNKEIVPLNKQHEEKDKDNTINKEVGKTIIEVIEVCEIHPYEEEIIQLLDEEIVGQDKVKRELAKVVVSEIIGFTPKKGNIGNLFFSGPTGVGKTQIIKALSKIFFGNESFFTKINCENFSESHTISSLFGSPNGYLGFNEKSAIDYDTITGHYKNAKSINKLHHIIENKPDFSILLFDEIEKAHPDIFQSLLSLMDEGKVTLRNSKKINLQNTLIIFTSNIGEQKLSLAKKKNTIGFSNQNDEDNDRKDIIDLEMKKTFSPEFLARVDKTIRFDYLNKDNCKEILKLEIKKLNKHLLDYYKLTKLSVDLDENVNDYIISKGYSKEKGARELVRFFNSFIISKLNFLLVSKEFEKYFKKDGPINIKIILEEEKIKFVVESLEDDKGKNKKETFNKELIPIEKNNGSNYFGLKITGEIINLLKNYTIYQQLLLEDEKIDLKDDIRGIEEKLIIFGFSREDLNILKSASAIQTVKENFDFIHDYSYLNVLSDDLENTFFPHNERVVYKILERIINKEYENLKNPIPLEHFKNLVLLKVIPEKITTFLKTDGLNKKQWEKINLFTEKIIETLGT